jgi:hypothetical protein
MTSAAKETPWALSCEAGDLELGLRVIIGPTSVGKSTLLSTQLSVLMELPSLLLVDWGKPREFRVHQRAHAGEEGS